METWYIWMLGCIAGTIAFLSAICHYSAKAEKKAKKEAEERRKKEAEMKELARLQAERESERQKAEAEAAYKERLRKAKDEGKLNEGKSDYYYPSSDDFKDEGDKRQCNHILCREIAVKGTSFCGSKAMFEASLLEAGEELTLQREPDNLRDPNAIKVLTRVGTCIGYLPADIAPYISEHWGDIAFCHVYHRNSYEDKVYVDALLGLYSCGQIDATLFYRDLELRDYFGDASVETYMGRYNNAAALLTEQAERAITPKEKYEAYKRACLCYRKNKDYDAEVILIESVLGYETEGFTKAQVSFFERRLEQARDKSLIG